MCMVEDVPETFRMGALSDIAEQVMAIPLQIEGAYSIEHIKNVRQSGNDLFLLSEQVLYRFDRQGRFICQVTQPEDIQVGEYLIDPVAGQLIVAGNRQDIHYYSLDGELLAVKQLDEGYQDSRLLSLSFFNGRIWSAEEEWVPSADRQEYVVERKVVEYDTSFRKINTYPVVQGGLGREQWIPFWTKPIFSVLKQSGLLYLYQPAMEAEWLLRDTLYLKDLLSQSEKWHQPGLLPVYPLGMGTRFWLASAQHEPGSDLPDYLFCYDLKKNQCWQLAEGLEDNFYRTGKITDLQRLDIYNNGYYFFRSAEQVAHLFPDVAGPVIFIVNLKS